ncbi:unnamed protein product [Meganyctiphanes norvegica]|uniref:Cytochrome c oxidase subunit n=1 Tax=Meganyctiphanes norvegica TaxID=48144 RepID=A0AAV2PWC9_MEGNR
MASSLAAIARRAFTSSAVRSSAPAADVVPHAGGMKQWKLLSFIVALPGVGLCILNAVLTHHEHEQPEFIPYEHLRIRNKRFPWGEGKKSLFHNSHVNALPDGYED